jgi:hypothetical protein
MKLETTEPALTSGVIRSLTVPGAMSLASVSS